MAQTLEAREQELYRIFSNDYKFEIPDYQRPYAWTTEQAEELLDDLLGAMGDVDNVDDVPPYFLGSIVLIKDPRDPRAQVVDGQQRLTTLTILLCVLRELNKNAEMRRNINGYIQAPSDLILDRVGQFRLSIRPRDQYFFENNILKSKQLPSFVAQHKPNLADAQMRMFENSSRLWDRLQNIDCNKRDRLTRFLARRCYLVAVSASDQDSAYRIFSVMNDRGLDLSPTDILKADIIGAMSTEIRGDYTKKWEDIEEDLDRDHFRDLFAHIRMVYLMNKQRGTLNQEFRDGVLAKVNGTDFVDKVLSPFAESYSIVSKSAYEGSEMGDKINIYLRYLSRLDNGDWIPPAILFFKYNSGDEATLLRFTCDLERLAYALFVQRANINVRIDRYGKLLAAIERKDDLFDNASPLQLQSDERNQVIDALSGEIYLQTRVRMPLLLRLDGALAEGEASYQNDVISIEHVLPQNPAPDSEWLEWFSTDEERGTWTHRLANLVLLSRRKNIRAQNYDFKRKKNEYFAKDGVTSFALTTQVVGEEEWNPDVLRRRQKELIDKLRREWRL